MIFLIFYPLQYNANNSTWTLIPTRLRTGLAYPGVFVVDENNVDCNRGCVEDEELEVCQSIKEVVSQNGMHNAS